MQYSNTQNLMIMSGGTGGHIFPAITLADQLKKNNNVNIFWLGTKYGLEMSLIKNYPIYFLPITGFRGKKIFKKMVFPFFFIYSIIKSIKIIYINKIKLIIGFGSYVSLPGGLAAKIMKIPLIIHEQNICPGMSNRILSYFSYKIFCAFSNTTFKQQSKIKIIGNPIRDKIKILNKKAHNFYKTNLNILILGGSQGSNLLNQILPLCVSYFPKNLCINIWHQCGKNLYEKTKKRYNFLCSNYKSKIKIDSFIEDMSQAYIWADMIICRSGALTVYEVACAGIPAFFIPLSHACDNNQYYNAQFLVNLKAAVCVQEKNLTVHSILSFILNMNTNRFKLEQMSKLAKDAILLDATDKMCKEIKNIF